MSPDTAAFLFRGICWAALTLLLDLPRRCHLQFSCRNGVAHSRKKNQDGLASVRRKRSDDRDLFPTSSVSCDSGALRPRRAAGGLRSLRPCRCDARSGSHHSQLVGDRSAANGLPAHHRQPGGDPARGGPAAGGVRRTLRGDDIPRPRGSSRPEGHVRRVPALRGDRSRRCREVRLRHRGYYGEARSFEGSGGLSYEAGRGHERPDRDRRPQLAEGPGRQTVARWRVRKSRLG